MWELSCFACSRSRWVSGFRTHSPFELLEENADVHVLFRAKNWHLEEEEENTHKHLITAIDYWLVTMITLMKLMDFFFSSGWNMDFLLFCCIHVQHRMSLTCHTPQWGRLMVYMEVNTQGFKNFQFLFSQLEAIYWWKSFKNTKLFFPPKSSKLMLILNPLVLSERLQVLGLIENVR